MAFGLTGKHKRHNTPISCIELDTIGSQANNSAHPQCFGLEFWETKETLQKQRNFINPFFGQGDANDAVTMMRPNLSPKVGNVDGNKSRWSQLTEQDRNCFIFDD